MRACCFAILATVIAVAPIRAQAPKQVAENENLKGVWKVVKAQDSDKNGDLFLGKIVKIDNDTLSLYDKKVAADHLISKLSFTVDPAKKPHEIDLFGYRKDKKSPIPLLGVFGFDKDRLRISWSKADGRDRPASIDIDPDDKGHRYISLTLERIKQGAK